MRYFGITILTFVFTSKNAPDFVLNHEKIHREQQLELFVVGAYILYFIEFLIIFAQTMDFHKSIFNVSFEREAFYNQHNPYYLRTRKRYSNFKYIKLW